MSNTTTNNPGPCEIIDLDARRRPPVEEDPRIRIANAFLAVAVELKEEERESPKVLTLARDASLILH